MLGVCLVFCHYLNQWWVIVNWIPRNKVGDIWIKILKCSSSKMHWKVFRMRWSFCLGLNVSAHWPLGNGSVIVNWIIFKLISLVQNQIGSQILATNFGVFFMIYVMFSKICLMCSNNDVTKYCGCEIPHNWNMSQWVHWSAPHHWM